MQIEINHGLNLLANMILKKLWLNQMKQQKKGAHKEPLLNVS